MKLTVKVALKSQSMPVKYEKVLMTYQRGSFYCLIFLDDSLIRIPISTIVFVEEVECKL